MTGRTWQTRSEPSPDKGCGFISTAGRSSWESKSTKERVTAHLSNGLAPKMDGAQVDDSGTLVKNGWNSINGESVLLDTLADVVDVGPVSQKYLHKHMSWMGHVARLDPQ